MLLTIEEVLTLYANNDTETLINRLWVKQPRNKDNLKKRTLKLLKYLKIAAQKFPQNYKVIFDEQYSFHKYYDSIRICDADNMTDDTVYSWIHRHGRYYKNDSFSLIFSFHIECYSAKLFPYSWGYESAETFEEYKELVENAV